MKSFVMHTPIGTLEVQSEKEWIVGIDFVKKEETEPGTPLLKEAKKQLEEYFSGKRKNFSLPLQPRGTEFQKKVWTQLEKIPYGETKSYGEIAKEIGNPKGARAVGMANNRNPISIAIPCHRVIGKDGKMVGYGGGLEKKVYLLELEKNLGEKV
ncbi:methylated-DNA--[protein]-cysteine S-methyltransferase [Peptoniphilus sp. KCTC 25270]|uniref:methylated-DNA--[protein]-cysteine S-methyltransferase n=1 Tax=Peptoniphilus sp. KCTC 25270 TaxID=2897414 RepID=UPI001E60CCD4|nr:methylated-DNA--[protein]-cysteine S-methyltransferase [Peptoniphilus sp. KCTC 25270]MCD1147428.1 methylated-DNA--[protein]-cysteine S-methyltransferase [Peptoniphilus sp. KCTC 25270]